jgi:hypothetical protein
LLVRMRTTDDKEVLLDNAKYLTNTYVSNVGINDKDLTPQERDGDGKEEQGNEAGGKGKTLEVASSQTKRREWLFLQRRPEQPARRG